MVVIGLSFRAKTNLAKIRIINHVTVTFARCAFIRVINHITVTVCLCPYNKGNANEND